MMFLNYLIYNSTVFYIFFTGTVIFIGYSLYNYAVTTVRPVLHPEVVILSNPIYFHSYSHDLTIQEWKFSEICYLYMDELCNNHVLVADLKNIIDSFTVTQLCQNNINEGILLAIQNFHG